MIALSELTWLVVGEIVAASPLSSTTATQPVAADPDGLADALGEALDGRVVAWGGSTYVLVVSDNEKGEAMVTASPVVANLPYSRG